MGIKQLFNKAAKGVKTFLKKDGTLEGLFNKGNAIFDKGSAMFDKGVGTALNLGSKIGETASNLAPALSINPELGLAAMAVGNAANKASNYIKGIRNKKDDITNKINDVRNKIMIPKPPEPIQQSTEPEINFA